MASKALWPRAGDIESAASATTVAKTGPREMVLRMGMCRICCPNGTERACQLIDGGRRLSAASGSHSTNVLRKTQNQSQGLHSHICKTDELTAPIPVPWNRLLHW